jgi:hypothetical protein
MRLGFQCNVFGALNCISLVRLTLACQEVDEGIEYGHKISIREFLVVSIA